MAFIISTLIIQVTHLSLAASTLSSIVSERRILIAKAMRMKSIRTPQIGTAIVAARNQTSALLYPVVCL